MKTMLLYTRHNLWSWISSYHRLATWTGRLYSLTEKLEFNGAKQSSYSLFSQHSRYALIKIFDDKSTNEPYHFSITNIGGKNYIEGIYIKESV
jgi:hypothetical protein